MDHFLLSLPFSVAILLMIPMVFVQNMAFTAVSRSRNGGDVAHHRRASWASNGVWFAVQVLFLSTLIPALSHGVWWKVMIVGIAYTFATTEGSCFMMRRMLKRENDKQRPGGR